MNKYHKTFQRKISDEIDNISMAWSKLKSSKATDNDVKEYNICVEAEIDNIKDKLFYTK